MKDKIKGFITGLVVGTTVASTMVLAATGFVSKDLWFNNIKITLDGKEVVPKDANGKIVEPFAIEGTTYLPLRAISNLLDFGVEWDADTNTVVLSTEETAEDEVDDSGVIRGQSGNKNNTSSKPSSSNGFEEAKNYLKEQGYKQVKSESVVTYECDEKVDDGTITIMYKENTDSILLRYAKDSMPGFRIMNLAMEIYEDKTDAELSMIIYTEDMSVMARPGMSLKKSGITKSTAISFKDEDIAQSILKTANTTATEGVKLMLETANNIFADAGVTVSDLGFTKFK